MVRTLLLVLVAVIAAIPALEAASTVVVTAPSTRSLQVVSTDLTSGNLVGTQVTLPRSLGSKILSTAVAGDFAFTVVVDDISDGTVTASLAVTYISDSNPQVIDTPPFPTFDNTSFAGCNVAPGDLAAENTGDLYGLYIYLECKSPSGARKAGNYVSYFTYSRSRSDLVGPSSEVFSFLNTFDPKYQFVSALNAISVFGTKADFDSADSGRGTVYAVLTTTSSKDGQIYKPALHVLADKKAVPLGILAKEPLPAKSFGQPRFAIASPTSFFTLYRQLCSIPAGGTQCSQPGFNGTEAVTLTRSALSAAIGKQTESWSLGPADLAVSLDQTLYRLGGGPYSGSGPYPPTLSARTVSAAPAVGFTTVVKELPFGSEGPGSPEAILELDAL